MKKVISTALLSFIILASACTEESKTISTDETSNTPTKGQPKVQYDSPIIVNKTDIILYPLRLNADDNHDSYKREANVNHWNLIFYDIISGKSELLTKEKININSFNIGHSENVPNNQTTLSDQFIYYNITDSDYDGDKKLTAKDPNKLYLSKLDGKSFTRISPNNYNLNSWKIDDKHDLILMDLIKDSNGDKEFNDKDEVEYFIYNLKTRTFKAVFDQKFKDEIKNLAKKVL
ncbi:hypothetical protein EZ456_14675 [Pedobacter psychrodurus]|uniref:Lipoprotein n=1 Tax=Pedobacter psychrodurus TaxID=2530456 RepID=A0A4R0Q1R9_9SPHI|nr:hypothetical protein [Pedobacter psychrodurus]TCD26253.1 hypothetical protein EZ456_14675 [Pedobacter psychrodurus]